MKRIVAGLMAVIFAAPFRPSTNVDSNSMQYQGSGTGAVSRSVKSKLGDVVSVKDFGAVADGATDNITAFTSVAAYANANPGLTVVFPDGTYLYSGGLAFTAPVTLRGGAGAVLNYSGSSYAVKMGADGLTLGTSDRRPYVVDGLSFIGGATMLQGIYFNTFITQARVNNTRFNNFGQTASQYHIFFQSQNWDARVSGVTMYADDTGIHNFIRSNGIASDGTTSDNGQTLLSVTNTLGSNQATNAGTVVGIYWNGGFSRITNTKLEGFAPNLWVGANAGTSSNGSKIQHVTLEVVRGAQPCIMYGEAAGAYASFFTQDIAVKDSYCNVHNTDFTTTVHFMGPAGAGSGLQNAKVYDNLAINMSAGQPLIVMNNLASQNGNSASGNRVGTAYPTIFPAPLHTAGASITDWDTTETNGDTFTLIGGGSNQIALLQNSKDASGVVKFKAGAATAQAFDLQFLDFNNLVTGQIECAGAGLANRCTLYGPGPTSSVQVYSDGRFGILKGIDGDSGGLKHKRATVGCATAAVAGAVCTTVVTWTTAFLDANYTATCSGNAITSGVPVIGGFTKLAASLTVTTAAVTAAAAQFTTIECIAVHD